MVCIWNGSYGPKLLYYLNNGSGLSLSFGHVCGWPSSNLTENWKFVEPTRAGCFFRSWHFFWRPRGFESGSSEGFALQWRGGPWLLQPRSPWGNASPDPNSVDFYSQHYANKWPIQMHGVTHTSLPSLALQWEWLFMWNGGASSIQLPINWLLLSFKLKKEGNVFWIPQ